jgi:hypothetical protein
LQQAVEGLTTDRRCQAEDERYEDERAPIDAEDPDCGDDAGGSWRPIGEGLTNIAVNSGAPTLLKQARELLDRYESLARRTIYEANRAQVTQSIEAAARDNATRAMTTATRNRWRSNLARR